MDLDLNLKILRERIEKASEISGRDPRLIEILPVTKYKDIELIHKLQSYGFLRCGENYVQEIERKAALLPNVEWVSLKTQFDWLRV